MVIHVSSSIFDEDCLASLRLRVQIPVLPPKMQKGKIKVNKYATSDCPFLGLEVSMHCVMGL
jgi:hypothetical protein